MPITEKYGELKRRRHAAYSAQFHTGYFYQHIREHDPACYACACQVDELIERYQAAPTIEKPAVHF